MVTRRFLLAALVVALHVHLTPDPLPAQEPRLRVPPPARTPPLRVEVRTPGPSDQTSRTSSAALLSKIVSAPPVSEEEEVVAMLADRLKYAMTVVLSQTDRTFPRGSMADRLSESIGRVDSDRRAAMAQRAAGIKIANADRGALEASSLLDAEAHAKLREAIYARLDAHREELIELLTQMNTELTTLERTWLVGGFFKKESQDTTGKKQIGLSQPQTIDFRWDTVYDQAERGRWQLFRPSQPLQPAQVIATGDAGPPGSIFSIDFGNYLPSEPEGTRNYHVRVVPQRSQTLGQISGITPGAAELALNLGNWSEPVIITYGVSTVPPQQFEFPEIYTQARFHLDWIDMVEDQTGAGDEEFFLMGFVQELWLEPVEQMGEVKIVLRAGDRTKFGPYETVLCAYPNDPCAEYNYDRQIASFNLNNPNQPEWPRSFVYVISVMEADAGDELAEWQSDIWDISDEILEGEIADMVEDYIDDLLDEAQLVHITAEAVQTVISAISSATAGYVAATVAALAITIFAVVSEMEDDFYGADSGAITLTDNLTGTVHSLGGKADGEQYFVRSKWSFYGPPLKGVAGGWDGQVDVFFHWAFADREPYVISK